MSTRSISDNKLLKLIKVPLVGISLSLNSDSVYNHRTIINVSDLADFKLLGQRATHSTGLLVIRVNVKNILVIINR